MRKQLGRLVGATALSLSLALGMAGAAPARAQQPRPVQLAAGSGGQLVVSFLDVGQGDCELLQMPTGENVLIDAGDTDQGARVVALLRARGVDKLDMVIMSHPHADHIGGLDDVLEAFPCRLALDAGVPGYASRTYQKVLRVIGERGVALKLGRKGMTKDYGAVHMEVLAPGEPLLKGTKSDPNNNSIVTRWRFGDVAFLMTGDVEKEGLKPLMANNRDLRAQILKVPHHGSRYTSTSEFLTRVKPEVAVISAGAHNDYHHPHKPTLSRLKAVGARVYVTAEVGTVTIATDGQRYQVTTER
jgi:competence protein ComEC